MPETRFRICSIGCGAMATTGHGPAYRKYALLHAEVELAACCDIDEGKASIFRERFGFARQYTDFRTMLGEERPDAVCLVVPVTLTAELSTKILEMGFPLIMEKPPGVNGAECRRMIAVAERTGIANQVAFNRRYAPLVVRLKQILSERFSPSEIQNLRYDLYRVGRTEDFSAAIHGIDTVRFLAGSDYARVTFRYQEFPHLGPKTANIFMDCALESGATAQLSFCPVSGVVIERAVIDAHNNTLFLNIPVWSAFDSPGRLQHVEQGEIRLDITGAELAGGAVACPGGGTVARPRGGTVARPRDGTEMFEEMGFYNENASFFDDLRAGRRPAGDIRSGLQSVEILERMQRRASRYP